MAHMNPEIYNRNIPSFKSAQQNSFSSLVNEPQEIYLVDSVLDELGKKTSV